MNFGDTRFDESVEPSPLSTMTQGYKILSALDELPFCVIAERSYVPEPGAETFIVAVRWPLESIELPCFDQQFICDAISKYLKT
jgi:hypothetical protein